MKGTAQLALELQAEERSRSPSDVIVALRELHESDVREKAVLEGKIASLQSGLGRSARDIQTLAATKNALQSEVTDRRELARRLDVAEKFMRAHADSIICECGEVRGKQWTRCPVCGSDKVLG